MKKLIILFIAIVIFCGCARNELEPGPTWNDAVVSEIDGKCSKLFPWRLVDIDPEYDGGRGYEFSFEVYNKITGTIPREAKKRTTFDPCGHLVTELQLPPNYVVDYDEVKKTITVIHINEWEPVQ